MSEPGMTIEIEDVLSSIRRLVSQETGVPRGVTPARRTAVAAVALAAAPEPELEDAPEALSLEAECLVLTPALRVGEVEPEETAIDEAFAETVSTEEPATDPEALTGEGDPAEAAEVSDDVAAVAPGQSEAEALLADAEAALSESDAVLEDAELALDEAWGGLAAEDAPAEASDLGDELARLESTIAEMEAAVAESGVEFEPEEGDRFEAAGATPLVDLPEDFDAEAFAEAARGGEASDEADAALAAATTLDEVVEIEEAELVEEEESVAAADDGAITVDPDLQDETWAEPEAAMDWAEAAVSLAQPSERRRLHLSDAAEAAARPEIRRSSYATMRDAFEDADEDLGGELSIAGLEEGLIDEEMLREMVAQLIREELRGTLGERITQNVRRLVRREIQRALMGQDFE